MGSKKKKHGNLNRGLERKTPGYPIEEFLTYVKPLKEGKIKLEFDGDEIKMWSQRYQVFKKNNCCVDCGVVGTTFFKEKTYQSVGYHMNLYGYLEDGTEVLITKDHILPKARGGKDTLDNYQTMCTICNQRKGDMG